IMKEKLKEIIKESGIEEIESILEEIKNEKSDDQIREEIKQLIIGNFNGCNVYFDGNYIDYKDYNNHLIGFYNKENNEFSLSYRKIWSEIKIKYGYNNQQIKEITIPILEELFNLKGVTTNYSTVFCSI
ncbi:MAG: hypothetical protein ACOC2U_01250, partial [bacterium]